MTEEKDPEYRVTIIREKQVPRYRLRVDRVGQHPLPKGLWICIYLGDHWTLGRAKHRAERIIREDRDKRFPQTVAEYLL
jgi:hypothetical protein